jgi:hypothetical protein
MIYIMILVVVWKLTSANIDSRNDTTIRRTFKVQSFSEAYYSSGNVAACKNHPIKMFIIN